MKKFSNNGGGRGANKNLLRAEDDILRAVGQVLAELKDPRLKNMFLTATECRLSPDMAVCKVWLSVGVREIGKGKVPAEKCVEIVAGASGMIKRHIAETVKMRKIPEIKFFGDESLDRAARIDEVLLKIKSEDISE